MSDLTALRDMATQRWAAATSVAGCASGSLAYHCTVNGARRQGNAVDPAGTEPTEPPSGSQIACRSPGQRLPSATAATSRSTPAPESQASGTELPATNDSRTTGPANDC